MNGIYKSFSQLREIRHRLLSYFEGVSETDLIMVKIESIVSGFALLLYSWISVLIFALIVILPTTAIAMCYSQSNLPLVDILPDASGNPLQRDFLYFWAAVVLVIGVTGIIGKIMTIAAIICCPRIRNATRVFITNLCVADLIFIAINLPFAVSRFIKQYWVLETSACIFFPFLRYFNMGLCLMTIAAMTVNHRILIVKPAFYRKFCQTRHVVIITAFLWACCLGLMMPSAFGKWEHFAYNPEILTCSLVETDGSSVKFALFIVEFISPCLISVVFYGRILWEARKSHTRILRRTESSFDISDHRDEDTTMLEEEVKMTKMILFVFFAFLFCCTPIVLIKIVDSGISMPNVYIAGYLLLYLSSAINPIVYAITNKRYRKAYKIILACDKFAETRIGGNNTSGTQLEEATDMIDAIPLVPLPTNTAAPVSIHELPQEGGA